MNTASLYHSRFFGVASYGTGVRFDTVEVRGSSPLVPAISSITYSSITYGRPLSTLGWRWRRGGELIIEKTSLRLLFRSSGSSRLCLGVILHLDRKSTRLNSSHANIS